MPAAIAVPAIVGGAAALGGAAISAHAAGSAAKQQKAAANEATALSGRIYDEQKQMLNPYIQAGTSSLARLTDAYWNNRPYGSFAPSVGGPVTGPTPGFQSALQAPQGWQQPRPQAPQGGGVLMRGPDGSTRTIAPDQVQRALAAGAVQVS